MKEVRRYLHLPAVLMTMAFTTAALAQVPGQSPAVDFTGIAIAIVNGLFAVVVALATAYIGRKIQNKQAADVLGNAVKYSLGALQQAADGKIAAAHPELNLPAWATDLAPAVRYVLDHAGPEAARFGITPDAIAGKIMAQVGLMNAQQNLAVTASPAPVAPPPLGPVTVARAPLGPVS